jgi:outer membrane lipoprotein carrier protein
MPVHLKKITTMSFLFTSLLLSSTVSAKGIDNVEKSTVNNVIDEETQSTVIKNALMAKLKLIKHFSGRFEQQVFDVDGNQLQTGAGKLSISKPNKVRWETKTPDESLIVSDGKTLWVFDPFIEQASAYDLQNSIANTPILLLTSQSSELWQNYNVNQVDDNTFVITSKDSNSQVKTLELSFAPQSDKLIGFIILDATGQLSKISLLNVNYSIKPDEQTFKFTLPDGVHLDDQR